jgi:hypothetical protein
MLELTALKANFKPKQGETEWPRHKLWYGVLSENITQAVCADLLRAIQVKAEEFNIPIHLHTHDELLAMSDDATTGAKLQNLMMHGAPDWAEGLPLHADISEGVRYTK